MSTTPDPSPAYRDPGLPIPVTPLTRDEALGGLPPVFRLVCAMLEKLHYGGLVFRLPDGRAIRFSGKEETGEIGEIEVKDFAFLRRALIGGSVGFYEGYERGEWDSPNLAQALYVFAKNADHVQEAFEQSFFVRQFNNLKHALNRNTKRGSKRNIMAHYDLGNAFYEKWLDATMTYSSARFAPGAEKLSDAQNAKYRALAERIGLKPGEKVLEIGSGWGGFAEFAAGEIGANVTGVTISEEQYAYSKERIFRAGLADKVDIRLQDYRDVENGAFDKAASIEMFEAVGKEYWPQYFSKLRDALRPGGAAGLQIITIADRFYPVYAKSSDFIQQYVFPGGMLPSPSVLREQIQKAGLVLRDTFAFGEDYARTLHEWHERFLERWDDIRQQGFDERFKKLWRFYLAYCEAGFRARTTDVVQVSLTRT